MPKGKPVCLAESSSFRRKADGCGESAAALSRELQVPSGIYANGACISGVADRRPCGRPVGRARDLGRSILSRPRILRRRASGSASWSAGRPATG